MAVCTSSTQKAIMWQSDALHTSGPVTRQRVSPSCLMGQTIGKRASCKRQLGSVRSLAITHRNVPRSVVATPGHSMMGRVNVPVSGVGMQGRCSRVVLRTRVRASGDEYAGVPRKLANDFKFQVQFQLLQGLQDSPNLIDHLEAFVTIQPDIVSLSFLEYVRDKMHTYSSGSPEHYQLEQLLSNLRALAVKLEQEAPKVDREQGVVEREQQLWQRQTELWDREMSRWNDERKAWERREAMLLGEIHRLQDALRTAYVSVGKSNLEEAQGTAASRTSPPTDSTPFAQMMNSALATAAGSSPPVTDFSSKPQGTIAPTGNPRPETTYHPSGVFPPPFTPTTFPTTPSPSTASPAQPDEDDDEEELSAADMMRLFAAMAAVDQVDVMDDQALSRFLNSHADLLAQGKKDEKEEDGSISNTGGGISNTDRSISNTDGNISSTDGSISNEGDDEWIDLRKTNDYDDLKKLLDDFGNVFSEKVEIRGEEAVSTADGEEKDVSVSATSVGGVGGADDDGSGSSEGGPVGPLEVVKGSRDGPPPVLVPGDDDIFWVAHLHQSLIQLGYYPDDDDVEDYFFGDSTAEALKYFQSAAGLPESGVADEGTWRALSAQTGTSFPGLSPDGVKPSTEDTVAEDKAPEALGSTAAESATSTQSAQPESSTEGTATATEAKVKWPVLVETDGGRAVHALQVLLSKAGYFCGDDEMRWWMFGDMTLNALKTFQACSGLPESGVCDERTWKALLGKDGHPSMLESVKGDAEYEEDMSNETEGRVYLIGEDRWAKPLPKKE